MENLRSGNPFCHIAIPAPDLTKAKSFYEGVFGWRVQADVPGARYWFFDSGNVGGAFDGSRKPSLGSVLLVIRVDDMQSALDLISTHGGTVTRSRTRIGDAATGYDAYFLDSNGNEMGIYSEM